MKEKSHMTVLLDAEKVTNSTSFDDKRSEQTNNSRELQLDEGTTAQQHITWCMSTQLWLFYSYNWTWSKDVLKEYTIELIQDHISISDLEDPQACRCHWRLSGGDKPNCQRSLCWRACFQIVDQDVLVNRKLNLVSKDQSTP